MVEVVDHLRDAGLSVWIDGGWGVDALLGGQTRDHDDVDLVVELPHMTDVLDVLASLGFELWEDHLPTRAAEVATVSS